MSMVEKTMSSSSITHTYNAFFNSLFLACNTNPETIYNSASYLQPTQSLHTKEITQVPNYTDYFVIWDKYPFSSSYQKRSHLSFAYQT